MVKLLGFAGTEYVIRRCPYCCAPITSRAPKVTN